MNEPLATKSKRNTISTILLVLLGCFILLLMSGGLLFDPHHKESPLVGRELPEFYLDLVNVEKDAQQQKEKSENLKQNSEQKSNILAKMIDSKSLKGQPLIINFWAPWCYSCRQETPVLEEFWVKEQKNVHLLGIAVQDTLENILETTIALKKSYPIAIDKVGSTSIDFGVTGVPETVFVHKSGRIVYKHTGPVDKEILQKYTKIITSENGLW